MRKTIIALAGAAAAAAAISAATLATAGTAAASAQGQTITLTATPVSMTCVPMPGQKPGPEVPGDQCVFSAKLARDGAPYGHDAVHCAVVTVNDLVCTAAFMLPPGQIAVAGDGGSTTGQLKVIPVAGGTGAYDGAQGYVVITNTNSGTSTVVFHLLSTGH
jgi:hypothetical protein